jgi:hypothetical protein
MIQHFIVFDAENLFGGLFHFPWDRDDLRECNLIFSLPGPFPAGEDAAFVPGRHKFTGVGCDGNVSRAGAREKPRLPSHRTRCRAGMVLL